MPERKRLTAKKVNAKDIITGEYFKPEGFQSNYLITPSGRRISRARILGTVMKKFVTEDRSYGFIVIDDETETIRAKVFNQLTLLDGINQGNIVDVIGKVREYEGELYLNLELAKKIKNPNWMTLRKLEILEEEKKVKELREKVKEIKNLDPEEIAEKLGINVDRAKDLLISIQTKDEGKDEQQQEEIKEMKKEVFNLIEELDKGEGAEYSKIVDESELEENKIEEIINDFLTEGSCYEPRPGRIKKL